MRVNRETPEIENGRRSGGGIAPGPGSTQPQFPTLTAEELDRLRDKILEACQPVAQNWPMKTFSYRNPLRGFEHLPFDQAIREGKHLLGGNGYISNEDYRQLYREGRISEDAVDRAIEPIVPSTAAQKITIGNRSIASADVLRLHLLFGFDALEPALLTWQLGAGGSTTRFRHDLQADSPKAQDDDPSYLGQLWDSTISALNLADLSHDSHDQAKDEETIPGIELPSGSTLSDWLELLAGTSLVNEINDQMIKWTAAFLDEGMANWHMPERNEGFYRAWRDLAPRDFSGRFLGIRNFAKSIRDLPPSPEDAIAMGMQRLGIPKQRWTDYLSRQLAQLPGWTGFIRWRSENPGYPAQKKHPIDPVQYLAVRLFYEVELVQSRTRREWGIDGTLGIFVFNQQGIQGAILQMFSHGIVTGAMFLAVGQLYERTHSRLIGEYGGLHTQMPRFVAIFCLFSVASFGLPGTSSFIGEFLVLLGTSEASFVLVLLAMGGIVLAASYILWMLQRVVLGQPATQVASLLTDLSAREMVTLVPLAMIVILVGVYPGPLLEMMDDSVARIVQLFPR